MDNSNSNSRGIGAGLVLLLVVSGGISALRVVLDSEPSRDAVRAEARDKRLAEQAEQAVEEWEIQQRNMQEVEAVQSEFGYSDAEMAAILQALWKDNHPDQQGGPWMVRVGNIGPDNWWKFRNWDPQRVRKACEMHRELSNEQVGQESAGEPE